MYNIQAQYVTIYGVTIPCNTTGPDTCRHACMLFNCCLCSGAATVIKTKTDSF
jgi:hypothetical protein